MGLLLGIIARRGGRTSGSSGGGLPTFTLAPTVAATLVDDGYYNAFGFPDRFRTGEWAGIGFTIYKKSAGHAPKGPMTFLVKSAGGADPYEWQIEVDNVPIECAALSMCIFPADHATNPGRILIAYQDDEAYTSIKFAYSDTDGVSFVSAGTLSFGAGYSSSPSPVKMRITPEGKIICLHYKYGLLTNPAIVGQIESLDNGESWAFGPNIFSHGGTGINDFKGHETDILMTHNVDGTDANSKWIAVTRNAESVPMLFHYSDDGCATWQTDTVTTDAGVGGPFNRHLIYGIWGNQQPPCLTMYGGLVYLIFGERNTATPLYRIGYMTATPDDAFLNNHSWSEITYVAGGESSYNGGEIDFGYPLDWVDYQGKMWVDFYDPSLEPRDPDLTEDRVLLKQILVAEP